MNKLVENSPYLYGDDKLTAIPPIIILERINSISKVLSVEINKDLYKQDSNKINDLIKSIEFWNQMIDEHSKKCKENR